ncbi:glycosyltransferase family 2 protein [Halomonas sp. NO4]|uniref:glycosyltransferase family 2 protein n=1 Tax=Halomonas sp. NO4 TaxID=2484813 RepID=UPI0013D67FA3|nr:glycosyltransferase family 2 protein [Halomonas sp. NO4]
MSDFSVSIIIASYNCVNFIGKAIQSAIDQTGCDVEIIVIDDASTDDTKGFVKGLNIPCLRYFRSPINKGPSHARNIALQMATKEWVAILDADDWLEPNRCRILIEYAKTHNLDVISDNQKLVDADSEAFIGIRSRNIPLLEKAAFPLRIDYLTLIRNPALGVLQPVFSRHLIERLRCFYDESYIYGEDYYFLIKIVESGGCFGVVNMPLYNVRLRQGSLVSNRVKMYEGMVSIYEKLLSHERANNNPVVISSLASNISSAKKTIVYARVVDEVKRKNYLQALTNSLRYPVFFLQLPERVLTNVKKYLQN